MNTKSIHILTVLTLFASMLLAACSKQHTSDGHSVNDGHNHGKPKTEDHSGHNHGPGEHDGAPKTP